MEFKELTKKDAQISLSMGKDQVFISFVNIVDQDESLPMQKREKKALESIPKSIQVWLRFEQLVFVGGCDVR